MFIRRGFAVSAAVATAIAAFSPALHAESHSIAEFAIPAQPLSTALIDLSKQANIQILTAGSAVDGVLAPAVSGRLTLEAALHRLLKDSEFEYRFVDKNTLVLSPKKPQAAATLMRTAQLVEGSEASASSVAQPSASDSASSADAASERRVMLEEVIVTGSHIRGAANIAAPLMTITQEDIHNAGYASVEALFEDLPQNFAAVSADGAFSVESGSRLAQRNIVDRVSAVDLRGLGPESTLTLLNGIRRAGSVDGRVVDISAIPLSVIERVEVVTGGRSAIYGSDAVAGVVNLVTRRSFDGSETQVVVGTPLGFSGGEKFQLSQIAGMNGDRGGIVGAYDYQRDAALDLIRTGLVVSPNGFGSLTRRLDLVPDAKRHSGFLSGSLAVTDRIELSGDTLYTHKEYESFSSLLRQGASRDSTDAMSQVSTHFSASAAAKVAISDLWQLNVAGSGGFADNDFKGEYEYNSDSLSFTYTQEFDRKASSVAFSSVASGALATLGAVTLQAAVGAEYREERFRYAADGVEIFNEKRGISSAFLELQAPLVSEGARRGLRHLELSLAGRYDDYEDVGNTFNPQFGVIWGPADSLTLRAAYSSAFRAPALFEQMSDGYALLSMLPDPTTGGVTPVLELTGFSPGVAPERADTWSLAFDYQFSRAAKVSMSYFEVDYRDRLDAPANTTERELALVNQDRYPGLLIRNPDAALVRSLLGAVSDGMFIVDTSVSVPFDPGTQDPLAVFPNLVTFDNRSNNMASQSLRALDLTFDANVETGMGTLIFGLSGAYTLDHSRRVTKTSPAFALIDEVGKPVGFRMRGKLGWANGAYGTHMFVNYLDDYENPLSSPMSKVSSWTTVDLTLRFDGSRSSTDGRLGGLSAALTINNLFDREPPTFRGSYYGLAYDAANANPFGRNISLRLAKRW